MEVVIDFSGPDPIIRMNYFVCNFIWFALISCSSKISIQKNKVREKVKKPSSGPNPCDSDVIGLKRG